MTHNTKIVNNLIHIVMFFLIVEIDVPFVRFHDFSDLADVAANVWAISAPKMEGA